MKDNPKVKQLNNIRVQLENLSHQCAMKSKRRTHADDSSFMLNTAAVMVCQVMNNIGREDEAENG